LLPKLYLAPFPRYSVANSKTTPPYFEPPDQGATFEFYHRTCQAERKDIGLHFSEICMILASAVLSQYTGVTDDRRHMHTERQTDRQTTYYDNSRTLHCKGRRKTWNI